MASTPRQKVGWGTANVLVVVVALIPVLWIVSLSFKDPATITSATFWPKRWTLENYRGIFKTSEFTRALVNSIGIALISTFIAVVFASMAAYAVARLDFPGKGALIGMSLLIAMFPAISLVSPLFNIERTLHLFNSWPGLIIPYITFGLPLAIYTLSAFFREIPWELEKAAKMDGATPFQAFTKVIAPLAARDVHDRHPGVHPLLERLPLRHLADLDHARPHRPGGHRLLQRQLAVHRADRVDRGRGRRHHDPDHPLRAVLPAPHRRRPHVGRGEGLAGLSKQRKKARRKWLTSSWTR